MIRPGYSQTTPGYSRIQYLNNNIPIHNSTLFRLLCSSVGCLGKTLAAKVQKLQNIAFRIVTRENYTTRSADILNKLKVPNLEKRRMQQLSILMYKVKNKLVPDYLYDILVANKDRS
jgi:hypothetical protein